jgi:hypothetical protein
VYTRLADGEKSKTVSKLLSPFQRRGLRTGNSLIGTSDVRRPLPRILLGTATATSFALCVTVATLWANSGRDPVIFIEAPWEVQVFDGHIRFLYNGTFQEGENSVPLWVFTLPFPILLWGWLRVERAMTRPVAGRCARCGYDLRATPDRCPECGKVPTAQPARPDGTGG